MKVSFAREYHLLCIRKKGRIAGGGYQCPCCGPGGNSQLKRLYRRRMRRAARQADKLVRFNDVI